MDPLHSTDPSLIWPDDPSFRNFPKSLPEDCVEYTLHVLENGLKTAALRSKLLQIKDHAQKLKHRLLTGYIWQREAFDLALSDGLDHSQTSDAHITASPGIGSTQDEEEKKDLPDAILNATTASEPTPLHLRGRTCFGDSTADEWLVVYLLRTLSSQHEDLWIRVWDSDGQFLLIEAANALPEWLDPEIADNRVWLHNGRLVMIPLDGQPRASKKAGGRQSSDIPKSRSLQLGEALGYLSKHAHTPQDSTKSYLDDDGINKEAFDRVRNYPNSINTNLHTSTARVPRKLAYLLHRKPRWVSPAIEAFYLRDPIGMRLFQKDQDKTLLFAPEDFVDLRVRMQRVGFAQLRGQEFEAPPALSSFSSSRPASSDELGSAIEADRRALGMKLIAGFEMLLADPANKEKQTVREIRLLLEDLEAGEEEMPTDAEIENWRQEMQEDSEEWLDIDWTSFERELKGQFSANQDVASSTASAGEKAQVTVDEGWGDKEAQENLRRMVARFEGFLSSEHEIEQGDSATSERSQRSQVKASESRVEELNAPTVDKGEEEDEEGADDASYHPTDSGSGSSEEEGWGESSENDEDDSDAGALNDEEEPMTDRDLQAIIQEMQSMGLKPPPGVASEKENADIREALLALSAFKAPKAPRVETKPTASETPTGFATLAGKAAVGLGSQKGVVEKKPIEDEEIEEIVRNMHDDNELSSDEELDPFDPAEVKTFEELFGEELRAAGALE